LIEDDSVDVVLSNCVLNLVKPEDKEQLFAEMSRVVRTGGRVAISDIVADDGHIPERGARMAVCDKTFQIYRKKPYTQDILAVEPIENIELPEAKEFDCRRTAKRHPREPNSSFLSKRNYRLIIPYGQKDGK